jgi:transposase
VRDAKVWHRALGLAQTVIEAVTFDEDADAVVAAVRPRKGARGRCGRCGQRASWYDRGEGRRRWRGLDLGATRVLLEADAPRVNCTVHGPTVIAVPWARHDARHTRDFDQTAVWLATKCSRSAVAEYLGVAWRTVGSILARVCADIDVDRLEGLRRIGIDELSYRRGRSYITVVVDHASGRLVWAAVGRDDATLEGFFAELGPDRAARITHVSADSAPWIERVVRRRCPNAVVAADPFHVVRWATDALDEVRRAAWNAARGGPNLSGSVRTAARHPRVHPLKRVRYALWKNPPNLTTHQRAQLDWVANSDPRLWRAYLLKEGLRTVFQIGGQDGIDALAHWLKWASRSRIPAFVELARRVRKHRSEIETALEHHMSNALAEATNTKLRLLTRIAYGFHSPHALIALALLALGHPRPALPGRP